MLQNGDAAPVRHPQSHQQHCHLCLCSAVLGTDRDTKSVLWLRRHAGLVFIAFVPLFLTQKPPAVLEFGAVV